MKIQILKTPEGCYFGCDDLNVTESSSYRWPHRINGGIEVKDSYKKNWYFCKEYPKTIEQKQPDRDVLSNYALIDDRLESPIMPLTILPEDVETADKCCDGRPEWKEDFKHLRSLYKPIYHKVTGNWHPVNFEIENLGEFESMEHIGSWSFPITKDRGSWRVPIKYNIEHNNVTYYLQDELSAPGIVIGTRPCFLTREQTFQIIREHVKLNINKKYAAITSDYDFSFKVEKIIKLATPEEYSVDVNAMSLRKRKPKYEKRFRTDRKQKIIEIRHSDKYDYGALVGEFKGDNLAHLKEVIDNTLEALMEEINAPLVECSACNGTGCVLEFKSQEVLTNLGK